MIAVTNATPMKSLRFSMGCIILLNGIDLFQGDHLTLYEVIIVFSHQPHKFVKVLYVTVT
jgi:hypothetical protein